MDPRERVAAVFDAAAETYDRVDVEFFQPIAAGLVKELAPMVGERGFLPDPTPFALVTAGSVSIS